MLLLRLVVAASMYQCASWGIIVPELGFVTCIRENRFCRWYGERRLGFCGKTNSNLGDVDEDGMQLVSWTRDNSKNTICDPDNGFDIYPGSCCCGVYGKSGCISGYRRLWCYRDPISEMPLSKREKWIDTNAWSDYKRGRCVSTSIPATKGELLEASGKASNGTDAGRAGGANEDGMGGQAELGDMEREDQGDIRESA